jgi:hypothetical protein
LQRDARVQPDASEVRAHLPNTSTRVLVARSSAARIAAGALGRGASAARGRIAPMGRATLALLLAGALAGGVAACGNAGTPSAAALVRDTFTAHKPIESGRIDLSIALTPTGAASSSAAKPFALLLQGPFQSLGPARLPRFALTLSLTSAGHTLQAGATSTAGQLYIDLAGGYFTAPASTVQAIQRSYAQATRSSSAAASHSTFAALGLDPGEWLVKPRVVGASKVAGAEATHVRGELDVPRFLADAEKLSSAGGSLGLGPSGQGGLSLLSPSAISALSSAVRSARVDLYTGAHDHLLRRLSVSAAIATTPQTRAALGGLGSASFQLTLQFAGINKTQTILPPSETQPISKLLPALEQLGVALGAGASG